MIIKRLEERSRLLLDGSMGQELLHRGVADDPKLWSAHAMSNNAKVVENLHREYIDAGADIITTNTYATNVKRFSEGRDLDGFRRLNRLAGEIARSAVEQSGADILVAGSLPPTRQSYRPDLVPSLQQMLDEYVLHAQVLDEYVDVFLCETMSTAQEGKAAATAALTVTKNKPVWVSWTLRDGGSDRLRSGETLAEAVAALEGMDVQGYLINCSAPESITVAMPILRQFGATVVGGYANGFQDLPDTGPTGYGSDRLKQRLDLNPQAYGSHVKQWLAAGANIVGGCCEVGPAHIAYLRSLV